MQWHPAFVAALHIEFENELDSLEIRAEHLLSKKPLQIDVLIIRKTDDIPIHKNIGQIFRKHNIIEYKSPEDSLNINDFYKAYAYTCLYQSDTNKVAEISPKELTITFVCNHYPYKLLTHLKDSRHLTVMKRGEGIYYLIGDEFPIQLIITKELTKEENFWLQSLRNNLKPDFEIQNLLEEYERKKQNLYYQAVMDLIVHANEKQMKEGAVMCDALNELLCEIFAEKLEQEKAEAIRSGLKQGIEQGETRTRTIFKLSQAGTPVDLIAKECGVSIEKVLQILN